MTDKQIIIDGVDVSRCPYYIHKDGSCSSHDCECVKCVHNVCFYKDYKAKEQECEELKNFHINLVGVKECEIKELLKLKQTLAEIKEIAELKQKQSVFVGETVFEQILQKISEVEDEKV